MNLNALGTAFGFALSLLVAALTIFRQRRFEVADIGAFAAAFLSGTNLPAAVYLCTYAFSPDPPSTHTKLQGLEKYISFAGLALLLVSLVSLWALCKKAYELPIANTTNKGGDGSDGLTTRTS